MEKISGVLEAVELIIKEGDNLKVSGHVLIPYVDAALFAIYPHKSEGDLVELEGILEEERDILRRLKNGEAIASEEAEQVFVYCHEMLFQLSLAEKGLPPDRRRQEGK
ncbi:MAG: hypothetical protein NUV59_01630 [Patescibacteria group bacterium]|nr:hypothetical protein [Patescibacteria group bacterium]